MKIFKILIISHIFIFLFGCKKEESIIPEGNIVGFVKLIDETGHEVIDKSGVNVSIEGLDGSVETNEDGKFEFTNVPAGTYNLFFQKDGYGSSKSFSYQFIGGSVPALMHETSLFEIPKTEVESLDITISDNIIHFKCEITNTRQCTFQAFVNDSSNVSNLNYDYASSITTISYPWEFDIISNYISLSETPYFAGDEIYLVIYFFNPESIGYYDFEKEMYVNSSIKKASNVIRLTIK